ncbi:hypothetical protein N7474_008966 [Penicillium riverlandense]|uniref:uncharacterized protein n=1 Tax=Penicillium riverlandense TaxID=1903569 RepID=UPI002546925D|nr:uncharacterized protein N7474_008966 [Penicillium riverlandense]KAJ5812665.1 hypothetical protein N7474_008966 [Penicillium riverlandense]
MSFEEPDPFYCNICGGPATTRALLKHSTFSLSGDQDEEDFDEEHELFHDYWNQSRGMHVDTCDFLKGYDSRLVSRWDIKVNTAAAICLQVN